MTKHTRDLTFTCTGLTLFEGWFLKTVVEMLKKGRKVVIESEEAFEKRTKGQDRKQ